MGWFIGVLKKQKDLITAFAPSLWGSLAGWGYGVKAEAVRRFGGKAGGWRSGRGLRLKWGLAGERKGPAVERGLGRREYKGNFPYGTPLM